MIAEIWNHQYWTKETDPTFLKLDFSEKLEASGFKVIKFTEYHFKPHGYTALWMLKESHLAIHSFPEEHKTYVELSSCNKQKYETFKTLATNTLVHNPS